jgi:hypothetical protein
LAEHAAGARCVRRWCFGWDSERRVEAGYGDATVGAHACARGCSLRSRVLRGVETGTRAAAAAVAVGSVVVEAVDLEAETAVEEPPPFGMSLKLTYHHMSN